MCTCSAVRIPNKKESKLKVTYLDLLRLLIFIFSHLQTYADADVIVHMQSQLLVFRFSIAIAESLYCCFESSQLLLCRVLSAVLGV